MINLDLLNENYSLTREQIGIYQKHNYIKLKQVLNEEILSFFNGVITDVVNQINEVETPISERDTYGKAFLQLMNLWRQDEKVKSLVFSKRIARIASELMQVEGVRLYHDQALFKEAGGGITPWHADQHYWPLASNRTVTVWIPLQETRLEMGPLEFSAGSQVIKEGRELEIGDKSEHQLGNRLRLTDLPHIQEPFDVGEVSFHSGWIFHRAGANRSEEIRKVMTIIYMDKEMRLKEPENDGQKNDWKTWCPEAKIGEIIDTPLNPILFQF